MSVPLSYWIGPKHRDNTHGIDWSCPYDRFRAPRDRGPAKKERWERRQAEKVVRREEKAKEKVAKKEARAAKEEAKAAKEREQVAQEADARFEMEAQNDGPLSDKSIVKRTPKIDSHNDFAQDAMLKPVMKPANKINSREDFAPNTIPDLQDLAGALAKEPYNLQKAKSNQAAVHSASRPAQGNISGFDGHTEIVATEKSATEVKSKGLRAPRTRGGDTSSVESDDGPSEFSDAEAALKSGSKSKSPKKPTKKSKSQAPAQESAKPQLEAGHNQKAHDPKASPSEEQCGLCVARQTTKPQTVLKSAMAKFVAFEATEKDTAPEYGSITLNAAHFYVPKMQFSGFPNALASKIGKEIAKYGGCGVKEEKPWGLGYQFILRGDPWGYSKGRVLNQLMENTLWEGAGNLLGDGGINREERFLRHVFKVMHENDYSLRLSSQMDDSLGEFYFKKSPMPSKEREYITISFHMPNRLRLTCAPEDLSSAIKNLLAQNPKFKGERGTTKKEREKAEKQKVKDAKIPKAKGHQKDKEKDPAIEYKIPGLRWSMFVHLFRIAPESRMKVTTGRKFRLDLLSLLEKQGWKEIHSAQRDRRKGTNNVEHVPNSWYLYRERTGEPKQKPLVALPSNAPPLAQARNEEQQKALAALPSNAPRVGQGRKVQKQKSSAAKPIKVHGRRQNQGANVAN